MLFERVEAAGPELPVRREPGIELSERLRVDPVPAPLSVLAHADEVGLAQHLQVLRHAWLADLQALDKLAHGVLPLAQQIEDAPARGLGEDFEDGRHSRAVHYCMVIFPSR